MLPWNNSSISKLARTIKAASKKESKQLLTRNNAPSALTALDKCLNTLLSLVEKKSWQVLLEHSMIATGEPMTEISQKQKKEPVLTTYAQILKEFQKVHKNILEETDKEAEEVKRTELKTWENQSHNKTEVKI